MNRTKRTAPDIRKAPSSAHAEAALRAAGGKLLRILVLTIAVAVASPAASVLDLNNGGLLTLDPGGTGGWGFSLINDTSYYMTVSLADLVPQSDPLPGAFTETLPVWFAINYPASIAPGDTLDQDWVEMTTGIGDVTLDASAPAGSTFYDVVLYYDLYSDVDLFDFVDSGELTFEGAEVLVNGSTAPVPEPSTLCLMGSAFVFILLRRRRW